MDNKNIEWHRHHNIRPIKLPNKEKYYTDLLNVEDSFSGRIDALKLGNTFIMESSQMIKNAIRLFEDGYFDSAYYSLRSAAELSTIMVFLSDMPETERNDYIAAWKETKYFPMQRKMIDELTNKGAVFSDMLEKMPKFFTHVKDVNTKLNKYVHKQGLEHFYVAQNYIRNNKSLNNVASDFESYLKDCIGIIAVMRLAIDPFPILLADEEILYRCPDLITAPYSEKFIEQYIGKETLECYKSTNLYFGMYNAFIKYPKKPLAVFNVTNNQYIDTNEINTLIENLSLMTIPDIYAVLIVYACVKIIKIYCYNGLHFYFTNRESANNSFYINTEDFIRFAKSENKLNQQYNNAYISVFIIENEPYYAEHNELLDLDDIKKINESINIR